MDDLFLKISTREIPSACVYDDAHFFAFLDSNPTNKGHTLVIPKTKYRNIFAMNSDEFSALAKVTHTIALAVRKATGADGVNIIMNNEVSAGQDVFHAHIHIIPRFTNDGVFTTPTHVTYIDGEAEVYAKKIRERIL